MLEIRHAFNLGHIEEINPILTNPSIYHRIGKGIQKNHIIA